MRRRGRRRVVSMSYMRDRVDRERQQQCCESNSQPLRRSSGQVHQAHEQQRMRSGDGIGYGLLLRL